MSSKDANPQARKTYELIKWPVIMYTILAALYVAFIRGSFNWFSWHTSSMVVAFIGLAINAAMIKKIGGYENTVNHGILMNLAVALGLFGWYVAYTMKEMKGKAHLTSTHAQLGVVVLVGYLSLGVAGLLALHPDFGLMKTNKTVRAFHKWGGRFLTGLAWYVCVTGKALLYEVSLI